MESPGNPAPPRKLKDLADGRKDLFRLRTMDQITVEEGFNARLDFDSPEDHALYDYIIHGGDLPPLLGHKEGDQFVITDGERRWRQCRKACEILGEKDEEGQWHPWARMFCLPEARGSSHYDRLSRMLGSNNGKDLTILEKGSGFHRMRQEQPDVTTESIAKATGYTRTHVEDCLLLATEAHEQLTYFVCGGMISPTLAIKVIRRSESKDDQWTKINDAMNRRKETGADRLTEKHFGDSLALKTKAPLAPPVDEDEEEETEAPTEPIHDDPPTTLDEDEEEAPSAEGTGAPNQSFACEGGEEEAEDNRDRTCPDCEALLADSDPGPQCWRCAPTEDVQPDDEGGASTSSSSSGSSGGGGGGRGERPLQSHGPAPEGYEPPVTFDQPFLSGLVEETKTTSSNDRRQTVAYLVAVLRGDLRRSHLIQWIEQGRVDP